GMRREEGLMRRWLLLVVCVGLFALQAGAQDASRPRPAEPAPEEADRPLLLKPARVFDGVTLTPHEGWVVVVRGERIAAAGPAGEVKVPEKARVIELPRATLLPGLIDA